MTQAAAALSPQRYLPEPPPSPPPSLLPCASRHPLPALLLASHHVCCVCNTHTTSSTQVRPLWTYYASKVTYKALPPFLSAPILKRRESRHYQPPRPPSFLVVLRRLHQHTSFFHSLLAYRTLFYRFKCADWYDAVRVIALMWITTENYPWKSDKSWKKIQVQFSRPCRPLPACQEQLFSSNFFSVLLPALHRCLFFKDIVLNQSNSGVIFVENNAMVIVL